MKKSSANNGGRMAEFSSLDGEEDGEYIGLYSVETVNASSTPVIKIYRIGRWASTSGHAVKAGPIGNDRDVGSSQKVLTMSAAKGFALSLLQLKLDGSYKGKPPYLYINLAKSSVADSKERMRSCLMP